jgi:hypothetical protein
MSLANRIEVNCGFQKLKDDFLSSMMTGEPKGSLYISPVSTEIPDLATVGIQFWVPNHISDQGTHESLQGRSGILMRIASSDAQ